MIWGRPSPAVDPDAGHDKVGKMMVVITKRQQQRCKISGCKKDLRRGTEQVAQSLDAVDAFLFSQPRHETIAEINEAGV